MTRFQVKAALDNAFYFLDLFERYDLRLPLSSPLTEVQKQTIRRRMLMTHWSLPSHGVPLRFMFRAWQVRQIENFHERCQAEHKLMDEVAAYKLGLK